MVTEKKLNFEVVEEFTYATVAVSDEHKDVGVITASLNYIPLKDFQGIFNFIGQELVKKRKIRKLVFDERNLTVFEQPAMEWLYTKWREKMFDKGLQSYRTILPDNKVFIKNIEDEKNIIAKNNPNLRIDKMDIKYTDSLTDALKN